MCRAGKGEGNRRQRVLWANAGDPKSGPREDQCAWFPAEMGRLDDRVGERWAMSWKATSSQIVMTF